MSKFRTITQAFYEIKANDPETALSMNYIRTILTDGSVPTIKAGNKVLVDMNELYAFLSSQASASKEVV